MITSMYRGDELQGEDKDTDKEHNNTQADERRKRVNRLKTSIIIVIIIMMVLPTILCIFLGLRVNELQKDVKDLLELHGQLEETVKPAKSKEHYVYAAESKASEDEEQEQVNSHDTDSHHKVSESKNDNKDDINLDDDEDSDFDDIDTQDNNAGNIEKLPLVTSPDYIVSPNIPEEAVLEDGIYKDKMVYLTFDDGPSIYTNEILDIMAEYNVKATFFVVGDSSESAKKIYKRIVDEGHAIGLHSYSHDYKKIYNSLEDFDKDFTKLWDLLYDTIGFRPTIFRFPGGSANQVHKHGMEEFIKYLNDKSVVYFDWNALNEDATGVDYTEEQLINNIISDVKRKNRSIVLMHDASSKKTTVNSLPELIETLIEGGATLLPLDEDVKPIQQIEASSIE